MRTFNFSLMITVLSCIAMIGATRIGNGTPAEAIARRQDSDSESAKDPCDTVRNACDKAGESCHGAGVVCRDRGPTSPDCSVVMARCDQAQAVCDAAIGDAISKDEHCL